MIVLAKLMQACGFLLHGIALPFVAIGFVADPILWLSRLCQTCAREWNPRLWQRGQHTDLHPPPGP